MQRDEGVAASTRTDASDNHSHDGRIQLHVNDGLLDIYPPSRELSHKMGAGHVLDPGFAFKSRQLELQLFARSPNYSQHTQWNVARNSVKRVWSAKSRVPSCVRVSPFYHRCFLEIGAIEMVEVGQSGGDHGWAKGRWGASAFPGVYRVRSGCGVGGRRTHARYREQRASFHAKTECCAE